MPNTLDKSYLEKSVWKSDIFKGKVAFITGGAGTICRVQAEALVLLGADVAIIGRNPQKTEDAAKEIATLRPGAKVIGIGNVDVRKIQTIKEAADRTVKELGRIDHVIAGAAGNFLSDFNHLSSNAFKSVIDIDLLGSFNTVKVCFEELRKNKGSVIFVSATLHYYGLPMQLHASAAKAGVDALSNALAVELGLLDSTVLHLVLLVVLKVCCVYLLLMKLHWNKKSHCKDKVLLLILLMPLFTCSHQLHHTSLVMCWL